MGCCQVKEPKKAIQAKKPENIRNKAGDKINAQAAKEPPKKIEIK